MKIGIIGGSGLYNLSDKSEPVCIETPFGSTSQAISRSLIGSHTVFFLPRHGHGHRISPTEINYRANIYALKKLEVSLVISVSAVGSLKKEIAPGDLVLPDQYIDFTKGIRPHTFFDGGAVAHAHFADPNCKTYRDFLTTSAKTLQLKIHSGGTYVCIEGPQFSTRSESKFYRSIKLEGTEISVIGMTALPEARLAREAGLCYVTLAMATDYDCWNEDAHDVTVEAIIKVLNENVEKSRRLITAALSSEMPTCRTGCRLQMKNAIVTSKDLIPKSKQPLIDLLLNS